MSPTTTSTTTAATPGKRSDASAVPYTPSPALSILYGAGMVMVFVGERVIGVGKPSTVFSVLGVLAAVAAFVIRAVRTRAASGAARVPERALLSLYALGLAALAFYFLQSDLTFHLTGKTLQARVPRIAAAVETLWPALWLLGSLPIVFVELALASMRRAPVIDVLRIRAAQLSGLAIGLALVFCFSVGYVSSERDKKFDLSYFRVARAGESTMKIVRALDKPVQVTMFFPPANEVREEVESYFADLARQSPQLQVSVFDHALAPKKAKELGVSGNGIIVISRDATKEQVAMPLQLERARAQLKVLDQDVNKRLLGVTRPSRIAYLTQGHEERSPDAVGDTDKRGTIRTLKAYLVDLGFEVKDLGLAQGLANEVPKDASVVLVVGPRKAFLDEEAASLIRYVDGKGRLMVALDPEAGLDLANLLSPLGVKFDPTPLANDRAFWRVNYQPSDRGNIAAASYSSHASVTTGSRNGARTAVAFIGAGSLEKNDKGTAGIVNVNFTLHAENTTWRDLNGNFEPDTNEARNAYELVAAISKRNASALLPEEEGRVVVLSDSDGLTDAVLPNAVGNAYLFADGVKWLAGEEAIAGAVNTEEDVPITHTRKQDVGWFYGTVILAPMFVMGIGFLVTRGRRRSRPRSGHGGGQGGDQRSPAGLSPAAAAKVGSAEGGAS